MYCTAEALIQTVPKGRTWILSSIGTIKMDLNVFQSAGGQEKCLHGKRERELRRITNIRFLEFQPWMQRSRRRWRETHLQCQRCPWKAERYHKWQWETSFRERRVYSRKETSLPSEACGVLSSDYEDDDHGVHHCRWTWPSSYCDPSLLARNTPRK